MVMRSISVMLAFALTWTSAAVSGEELVRSMTIRDVIEASRAANVDLVVDLRDGDSVTGSVGRTKKSEFYVLNGTVRGGRAVAYRDISEIRDASTGQRLAEQIAGPPLRQPGSHLSQRALMWFGIVVGAVIVGSIVLFHGEH